MSHKDIYDLHLELLQVYERWAKSSRAGQAQITHFKKQFFLAEDSMQRIFVMNQLIKIYEMKRERIVKFCSDEYFITSK